MAALDSKGKYEKLAVVVHVSLTTQKLVISRCCLAEKKYTKIYNARAQLLFCSLNLLFSDVLVAFIVVVCLGPVQTPNFTWAESNANEGEQRILLICIQFGWCEVRRLNLALSFLTTWNCQILRFLENENHDGQVFKVLFRINQYVLDSVSW